MWERSTSGPKAHRHTWAESMQPSIALHSFLCVNMLFSFSSSCFCLSSVPDSSFVSMDLFLCVKGCCLSHCKGFTAVFHSDWLTWNVLRCNIHWQKHKCESGQLSSDETFPIIPLHYFIIWAWTFTVFLLSYQLHGYECYCYNSLPSVPHSSFLF